MAYSFTRGTPFWDRGTRRVVVPALGPCLEWVGARHKRGGYGEFRLNGQKLRVHRHAWELTHGPIPSGHVVLHRCDNPACFEPTHLELGTQHDNLLDMVAKGRGANQYGLYGARA